VAGGPAVAPLTLADPLSPDHNIWDTDVR